MRPTISFGTSITVTSFNSRTPRGVRQRQQRRTAARSAKFQFTHPAWGATQNLRTPRHRRDVSIHAPRVGCYKVKFVHIFILYSFNSRTPRGVRRLGGVAVDFSRLSFQFTHPAWGATHNCSVSCWHYQSFNSRTPRGVRHTNSCNFASQTRVSIHAPRVGCDTLCA